MCNPDVLNRLNGHVTTAPVHLLSPQRGQVVLLQTLGAKVSGRDQEENCRMLLDGGSQRSFIRSDVSRKLSCELLGEETLSLGVFGGKEMQETLKRVRVFLHCLSKQTTIPIEGLEIESICNQPIPNPNEEVLRELQSRGIDTKSISNESNAEDSISLLIGSDFYW